MDRDTVQRLVGMTEGFDEYLDEFFEVFIEQLDGPLKAAWSMDRGWQIGGIE